MDRLTRLRATESLLNRNSKSSSEGRRTKEPSDPESTLRLASRKKNCVTPRSLCDTDRRGSVLRDRHAGERSKPGLTVIVLTLQLPTVLSHSKVIKPDAFSAFVFSLRQTRISRDLDIRFLTPLLRSLQTENIRSTNA